MTASDLEFIASLRGTASASLRPPPVLPMSQWADARVMLPGDDGTAEPGPYRTSRTPYMREIADWLSRESDVSEVVIKAASQVGKSQLINNWILYTIDRDPSNIIVMQPTKDLAETYSKMRVEPLLRANPWVYRLLRDGGKKRSEDTTMLKPFVGGFLRFVGANAPGDLASIPAAKVAVDELDRCSQSAGNEGDQVELLRRRMSTFPRRKMLIVSSPGAHPSKIEERFMSGDQCRLYVPCPHCEGMQVLRWGSKAEPGGVVWQEGRPETAQYQCDLCGALIDHGQKTWMLERGELRASATSQVAGLRSVELSALYSPVGWYSWADAARDFVAAGSDPVKLQVFWNTVLAQVWHEQQAGELSSDGLLSARERYGCEVPVGVTVLTMAVDVQGDRLEVLVKGWGAGEESWDIFHARLAGDPTLPHVWQELDELRARIWTRGDGKEMTVKACCVDSGDGNTSAQVYGYCGPRAAAKVWAIKGRAGTHPIWSTGKPQQKPGKARVCLVGVDVAKRQVYARLRRAGGSGAGMIHFPIADWCDAEYCEQLTSEAPVDKRLKNGRVVRGWSKVRDRNEALDLQVYNLAALHGLIATGHRLLAGAATPKPPKRGATDQVVAPSVSEVQTDPQPETAPPPKRVPYILNPPRIRW